MGTAVAGAGEAVPEAAAAGTATPEAGVSDVAAPGAAGAVAGGAAVSAAAAPVALALGGAFSPPFHNDQATTAQAAAWSRKVKEGLGRRKRS
ncbi:MAG: hypothetical protein KGJ68_09255, partial [Gammaproteobacteria bacterium]|nr:hypothetical protein [Gammaproteobacteria bacterium]